MLNALSLNVGEFFAETSSNKAWLITKKSLTDGVRECLQETLPLNESSDAPVLLQYFVSQNADQSIHFNFEQIAFFVTSGFENLLELTAQKHPRSSSRLPKNSSSSVFNDTLFGISERTDASGNVIKAVELADLEFILAKLQLLSIQDIAIGFLHSNTNSENELKVAEFFRAKGLQVFCSCEENKALAESLRWQNALLKTKLNFRQKQVESQLLPLKSQFSNLQTKCLNPVEVLIANDKLKSHSSLFFADKVPDKMAAHLHLGLEGFILHDASDSYELEISATNIIASGFFNTPEFANEKISYDPGPMIMGKSFVPSLIDFLFAAGLLSDVEIFGLANASAERAKPRILESILTLVRNNQERKHIDIQKELLSIEKILSYRIWSEILKFSNFKRLKLSGPLAASLLKIIKNYRPQGIEISL